MDDDTPRRYPVTYDRRQSSRDRRRERRGSERRTAPPEPRRDGGDLSKRRDGGKVSDPRDDRSNILPWKRRRDDQWH